MRQVARRAKKSCRVVSRLTTSGMSSGRKYDEDEAVSAGSVQEQEVVVVLEARAVADSEMVVPCFADKDIACHRFRR